MPPKTIAASYFAVSKSISSVIGSYNLKSSSITNELLLKNNMLNAMILNLNARSLNLLKKERTKRINTQTKGESKKERILEKIKNTLKCTNYYSED